MRLSFSLSLLLALLMVLSFSTILRAGETKSERLLRREIDHMISRSKSPRTLKAIQIYSRRHRRTIYSSDAGLLLHPASNLKIVTTSFALHSLGTDYLFTTPFEFAGLQRGDSLIGDLVVVGTGDPILSLSDLDSAARAVYDYGIHVVTGNLVIDVSRFDSLQWGTGWMWDDEPEPYAMFISPATFDHDIIKVSVSLDSSGRALAVTTDPATSFVKVDCMATPGSTDSISVTRVMVHDTNTIVVAGTYTTSFVPESCEFSVRHPAHYFGTVLREFLANKGVEIDGHIVVTRNYADHAPHVQVFDLSHAIDTVVTYTNKVSDNLGAECLLREVPMTVAGEMGSAKNGIALERKFLEHCGVDSTQFYIVDGSGVSHYNLITPDAIVKVLRYDLDQPYASIFIHSLPTAGEDGTLKHRMTQDYMKGRVLAKTGSISGVSTLSGYVILPRDTLVFSMMMQNFIGSSDSMRILQDNICSVLSQYNTNSYIFERNLRRCRIGTYGVVQHHRRASIKRTKESGNMPSRKLSGPREARDLTK